MEIDHNKNNELQVKALEVYHQKESELSEILLGSIIEDVFNPANIDSSTPHSQNVPKHLWEIWTTRKHTRITNRILQQ